MHKKSYCIFFSLCVYQGVHQHQWWRQAAWLMALEIDEKGPVIVIMHCIIFSTWIILRLTLKINLYGWCCCMFARNFSSNLMFSFAPSRFPTGYGDKTNTRGIFPNKLFLHELLGLHFIFIYNRERLRWPILGLLSVMSIFYLLKCIC